MSSGYSRDAGRRSSGVKSKRLVIYLTARNNVSGSLLAVSQFGRYRQFPLLAYAHVQQALIPTLDDLSYAQLEGKRLISVQAVTGNAIIAFRLAKLERNMARFFPRARNTSITGFTYFERSEKTST